MTDTLNQRPTSAVPVPSVDLAVSKTMTIEEKTNQMAEEVGHLRNQAALLSSDLAEVHQESLSEQLSARIENLVAGDPTELLDELADMGFGWQDIARMVGVSVPALRRWRGGDMPTGANRRAIAQLLAFVQIITEDHLIPRPVYGPASWMEVPIVDGASTTRIDLYAAGHLHVVLDLASQNKTPQEAMDAFDPDWRDRYRSDWVVGTADDGQPYLHLKPGR